MAEPVLVLTTVGSRDAAQILARHLVEQHLAACVSISGPILSIYRWKGVIEKGEEFQLLIKSLSSNVPSIEQSLNTFHRNRPDGYELPELLVVPLSGGSAAYLDWLRSNAQPDAAL